MKQLSPQSKSFIILAIIAVAGTIGTIVYSSLIGKEAAEGNVQIVHYPKPTANKTPDLATSTEELGDPLPAVDTSDWKEYTDTTHALSFKYNPDWKVITARTRSGWYVLQVDPGPKYDNIKIFMSEKDFFAMEGLPTKEEQIAGTKAISVLDMLYGLRNRSYYYTFDLGASVSLQPQFEAMVKTVKLLE